MSDRWRYTVTRTSSLSISFLILTAMFFLAACSSINKTSIPPSESNNSQLGPLIVPPISLAPLPNKPDFKVMVSLQAAQDLRSSKTVYESAQRAVQDRGSAMLALESMLHRSLRRRGISIVEDAAVSLRLYLLQTTVTETTRGREGRIRFRFEIIGPSDEQLFSETFEGLEEATGATDLETILGNCIAKALQQLAGRSDVFAIMSSY